MNEFSRPVLLDRIGAGAEHLVEARPEELEALAKRLMIPAINRLSCRFRLRRTSDSGIAAEGQLEAEVVQICVLTLDEFPQPVSDSFAVEFVPEGTESDELDPDMPDQIGYAGGTIDLGEAAAEQLALALDPYPKKPGAEAAVEPEQEAGAFAALAALRRPQ